MSRRGGPWGDSVCEQAIIPLEHANIIGVNFVIAISDQMKSTNFDMEAPDVKTISKRGLS